MYLRLATSSTFPGLGDRIFHILSYVSKPAKQLKAEDTPSQVPGEPRITPLPLHQRKVHAYTYERSTESFIKTNAVYFRITMSCLFTFDVEQLWELSSRDSFSRPQPQDGGLLRLTRHVNPDRLSLGRDARHFITG